MTYAIGNIVFGVDLQDNTKLDEEELDDLADQDIITRQYSGGDEAPVYFGVDMAMIDECTTYGGDKLINMLTVTDAQRAEYAAMLAAFVANTSISQEIRDFIANTEPSVFLTWGTS